MKFTRALFVALPLLMSSPALAEPFTYAPEGCEFKVTFPEKPYITQKCSSGDEKKCEEVVSYTKVINIDSSVNFRVICSKATAQQIEDYTDEDMRGTVEQMATEASLEPNEAEVVAKDDFKSATIVTIGDRGDREVFYTAQLWVGKKSIMSLEGDMSGPQSEDSDKVFTEVLKNTGPIELPMSKPPKAEPSEKKEEKKDEKKVDVPAKKQ